jgi:hyperpolarization activated cyclic nucleotide-gated potassium channel 2
MNSSVMRDAPGLLKLLKVSKLLKMLKLLRVAKLKKLMMKFEEYIVTDSMDLMVTFFNITVKIVFIAHYMGCFFYYYGLDELRNGNSGWLLAEDMLDKTIGYSYITSMYWAFTTMSAVGYGDITPVTRDE